MLLSQWHMRVTGSQVWDACELTWHMRVTGSQVWDACELTWHMHVTGSQAFQTCAAFVLLYYRCRAEAR